MGQTMANEIVYSSIGVFHSDQKAPYEAGRQPDEHHTHGRIELFSGHNFEQALEGLQGCPRIWVLFQFHHNAHWNPMVLPPRGTDKKVGVFATRSPYRPNNIGMSCVRVLQIDRLKIDVAGADILDQSPIIDIKPYVAYADSFPGIEPEWLSQAIPYRIHYAPDALASLEWLESQGLTQLRGFLQHQLEYEPTNSKKKRVKQVSLAEHIIAYKTWRACFNISSQEVTVTSIGSGYSAEEISQSEDPYGDKSLHQKFMKLFPPTK